MHECPTCGDTFDNRRGVAVHHSGAHGEKLPNRECSNCGTEFHCKHEKKYCSEECRSASVSFEGKENPNYRGGKETTECEICSETFDYYPSEKEGLYCPDCVETESWRDVPYVAGSDHPNWAGGKVTHNCEICDAAIERYPSEFAGTVALCDDDCRSEWLSAEFTGEGHPNWEGGDVGPYGQGWAAVRRAALERDGYRCVACGEPWYELGRNPDVHHITPVRTFVETEGFDSTDAHRLDNVVSLCVGCHRRADAGAMDSEWLRSLIDPDDRTVGPIAPPMARFPA